MSRVTGIYGQTTFSAFRLSFRTLTNSGAVGTRGPLIRWPTSPGLEMGLVLELPPPPRNLHRVSVQGDGGAVPPRTWEWQ